MQEQRAWLSAIERVLCEREQHIGLLARLQPSNFSAEVARLTACPRSQPHFVYPPPVDLSGDLRALDATRQALARQSSNLVTQLFIERCDELERDVRLVQARGTDALCEQSSRRFAYDPTERQRAHALALEWLREPPEPAQPRGALRGLADSLRLHERVRDAGCSVVEVPLISIAAISHEADALLVQRGARANERDIERVVVHELGAHLLPRIRAKTEPPPYRLGTSACSEDEEGRAILLELRADLLDPARKRELAARYLASDLARTGGDWDQIFALLRNHGIDGPMAVQQGLRALRGGSPQGGGLGREVVYLASFLRVRTALLARPELESFMERGRISIAGAASLADQDAQRAKSTTTGA